MSAPTANELLRLTPSHIIGSVLSKPLDHKHDAEILAGLSTATKPTDLVIGSLFLETDTARFYFWNGTAWTLPTVAAQSSETFADGSNIILGTATGTKIGTATTQKLGFYNATPVIQGTGIADVNNSTVDATYDVNEQNVITSLRTTVNTIIARLEATGLIATV
jgi:hypothetical protein